MRAAVIDLGSNSVRLLIKDISDGLLATVHRELATTRLGRGVVKNSELDRQSVADTLSVVEDFIIKAKSMGAERIFAFGTSALREAKNSGEFIKKLNELGLDVDILPGEKEALLSFIGARAGLGLSETALVMDIGGGSTELILGKEQILKSVSLPLGAVRFTELYFKSEPPNFDDVTKAGEKIRELCFEFASYFKEIQDENKVVAVGVGGTLTTLAAMDQKLEIYDADKVHGYVLKKASIDNIYSKLLKLTTDEKRKLPGLMPQRADIIAAGTFIARSIMENLDIDEITVSETDLMEGYLLDRWKTS